MPIEPLSNPDGQLVSAREHCRQTLLRLAQENRDILCLDSDIGGLDSCFGDVLPEQYFDVGIAEANMMSIAAGLAKGGCRPVAHTMAGFASTRACEQVKLDIAYHDLPVVIIGSHGGLSAGHYGMTHFCVEDLAILRSFPNLTVVVPCDAYEAEKALVAATQHDGPIYIRLGRNPTPILHRQPNPFEFGRAQILRDGADITIIGCGPHAIAAALEAAELSLSQASVRVINMHTIKPLDTAAIVAAARETKALITVEEHTIQGGLGGAICEVVAQKQPCPVTCVGVPEHVPSRVGDEKTLLEQCGISAPRLRDAILRHLALPQ
ncbi:transketolase family protein [Ruegeria atlantica]|uniref:transketolase family protein n=1 Tax=Ruegeria atlantica TaxID=81569 RepID=UPI00147E4DBE|nr:transketolase C-terminal domain-containing protein [Ruegeria atlantica]